MHGIIFSEMRKYIDAKLGDEGWDEVLVASKLGRRLYLPIQEYPDADMVAIVVAAAQTLDLPAEAILEDFGKFIAPSLLGLYRTLVDPKWRTLDLLENTEHTIHTVVRARNPGARPARLHVVRKGDDVVELTYRSERRMCAVAKGIIKGVADHYGDTITIEESACMHHGGEACRMQVRVVAVGDVAQASDVEVAAARGRTPAAAGAAKKKGANRPKLAAGKKNPASSAKRSTAKKNGAKAPAAAASKKNGSKAAAPAVAKKNGAKAAAPAAGKKNGAKAAAPAAAKKASPKAAKASKGGRKKLVKS